MITILVILYIICAGIMAGAWWGHDTDWNFGSWFWKDDCAYELIPVCIFWPAILLFFIIQGLAFLFAAQFKRRKRKLLEKARKEEEDNRREC